MDCLHKLDKLCDPDWFCHRNNTFSTSERWTTAYLRTMDRRHAPKGQVAVQNSLQKQTEIETSGGKCEICIKVLTDGYSAAPRSTLVLSIFVRLVSPHEVADLASCRPLPSQQLLQPHALLRGVAS